MFVGTATVRRIHPAWSYSEVVEHIRSTVDRGDRAAKGARS